MYLSFANNFFLQLSSNDFFTIFPTPPSVVVVDRILWGDDVQTISSNFD